jgi:rhodanese-related sulfurtransferase
VSEQYGGDITPQQAWEILQSSKDAVLIDVRTEAEWAWVGQVNLSSIEKEHLRVEWNRFPGGMRNEDFVEDVAKLVPGKTTELLLLCRSGVRSRYAAIALTAAGYEKCYNIEGGFEGDHDANRHRGTVNGWKVAGLAWMQG